MDLAPASPAQRLKDAAARVADRAAAAAPDVTGLSDEELLALLEDATETRKALELVVASASAEVSRRSARDLGYRGLAQRKGVRTGTALVQQITGLGRADVTRAVQAGEELAGPVVSEHAGGVAGTDAAATEAPAVADWLQLLRAALVGGHVSQAQFHAIRTGLGEPPVERYPALEPGFLEQAWARAVALLLNEAPVRPVEELRDQARIARDRLDPVGVTLRFEERFARRSFRTWTDESGQKHGRFVFDDEAGAFVDALLQAALRPRRGPRFVGADADEIARAAEADERTNEQVQYDTIVAVLRTGASADPQQAFGDRQPGVRIVLEGGAISDAGSRGAMRITGVGHLEDGGQALPAGVVEARLCDAGAVPVLWGAEGRPLDVGRELRLFTRKQRVAIATRDGGCVWPACGAPISQCEYHHIDHWWEHHGRTDVDDGVPLCRNCHLRLHNQGWRITRTRDPMSGADGYWLHPPPDPATGEVGEPTLLTSKSPRRFEVA
ncbi:HNH endonuclease [Microbacterium sp. HD4P20]|uniref:HNH endonuclease signature motif containing protein n=1 Tax=Microbacterium sp. HD4P20 TaxID=2864874 RepID=UPI001C63F950|nr:HNH endonuclease signature motif containing protein [Microbacterium sp. HD4P20]MCP2638209.1 HNH endonuclease [Microbacterium sp. HD4P20]